MWTSIARSGYGTTNTHDVSLTTSATSLDRLREVFIAGEASAAQYSRNQLRRDNSNGGTPTAITQTKTNPRSAAPGLTAASVFASNPALSGVVLNLGLNNFGGMFRWYAGPDEEIYIVGSVPDNELSLTDALNRGYTQSMHMIVEEL